MFKGLANLGSLLKQAQQIGGRMQELNEELKSRRRHRLGRRRHGRDRSQRPVRSAPLPDRSAADRRGRPRIDRRPGRRRPSIRPWPKPKQLHAEAMQSVTGGMNLPGLDEAMEKFLGRRTRRRPNRRDVGFAHRERFVTDVLGGRSPP